MAWSVRGKEMRGVTKLIFRGNRGERFPVDFLGGIRWFFLFTQLFFFFFLFLCDFFLSFFV